MLDNLSFAKFRKSVGEALRDDVSGVVDATERLREAVRDDYGSKEEEPAADVAGRLAPEELEMGAEGNIADRIMAGLKGAVAKAAPVVAKAEHNVSNAASSVAKEGEKIIGSIFGSGINPSGGEVHAAQPIPVAEMGVTLADVLPSAVNEGGGVYKIGETAEESAPISIPVIARTVYEFVIPEREIVEVDRARSLIVLFLIVGGVLLVIRKLNKKSGGGPTF